MTGGHDGFAALELLACGLAGIDVALQPLAGERAVLTGSKLLLPEGSCEPDLRRAMVAHAVAHLRHSASARPARGLKPMGIALASAIEDARVERLLCRDFPGLHRWFANSLPTMPDPLDLRFAALLARMDRLLLLPAWRDDNHWVNKARRLFEETASSAGLEDDEAFRAIASVLANDLGQMRVRFEPRTYIVPAPWRDDNSHLWDFGEVETAPDQAIALQQPGAQPPTRPPPPSEVRDEGTAPPPADTMSEVELGRCTYPEWDHKLERLLPDWCTVIEKRPAWPVPLPARGQATTGGDRAARPRARGLDHRHRLRRQWEGDDIDLDAAVEVLVDRRLRLQPDARLFMRPARGPRPSSLLVLLDLSASANDPGPHAASLLDIEKQAALLLAASNAHGSDRLAIHGFSSNTRAEVHYYRLLDFGQPLDTASRAVIGTAHGGYSTRMGAALRHAASHLLGEPAGQRAILILTDGAPSDVDVHDPRYLIEDARQAVAEARTAGVRTTCLAVSASADAYVQRIFGWRDHGFADDVRTLPRRLMRMSARLHASN